MRTFKAETLLYLLALLLGLTVRLIGLGALPLTDLEAKWALQALAVARGTHPALGSQPAYLLLTALLFFASGGGTNALARLIPALTGTGLILVPRLFRERLKPRPALILAFALALEPGLVALSRQAGSSIMALTFVLAAWGLWESRSVRWAGICGGLALLSGPPLWFGLIGLALAWAILLPFERHAEEPDSQAARHTRGDLLMGASFALGTIIVVGTLFFLAPSGLSAWLFSLPQFLLGWVQRPDIASGLMLFSLAAYQPLGLVLAVIAGVRGWVQGSLRARRLSIWMLVSLLMAVFYPARQISDLAWMLIPLWALAALELARSLNVHPEERREVLGVAALLLLILAFMWLNFLGLVSLRGPSDQTTLRTWLMLGSFFLLIVSLLLVAAGWSARIARYGATWGIAAALGIYTLAALMSTAGLRKMPDAVDLWRPGGSLPESGLLLTTVQQMSDWSDTAINAQPVTVVGIDSPALMWLVRERTVKEQSSLDPSEDAPMLITINQDNPMLDPRYRGQSFVWRRTPLWDQATFSDWLQWLTFHQVAQQSETVILWTRSDLFIDSTAPKP